MLPHDWYNTCRCKGNVSACFINIYLAKILGKPMPLITLIFSWFYLGYA